MELIQRFNERLKAGGSEEQMTLNAGLRGEARYRPDGFPVYRRMMIASDGEEIRAAVLLFHHNIFISREKRDFCWADMPLCEGIIDNRYSLTIIQLMKKALSYQPFLITTGVGTSDIAAFKFFSKLGWRRSEVPFFFYPVKVNNVLRGMNYLKNHSKLRYGAIVGSYLGAGAGASGLLAARRKLSTRFSNHECSIIDSFDDWADLIFDQSLPGYEVAIRSDATTLNIVYPADDPRYFRLRVRRKSTKRDIGWVVTISKQMHNNPYFGDLKVGTLADGFGQPADAPELIAAGINHLIELGVDLIVGNFAHTAWVEACRKSGMFRGPSNYQIFVSPNAGDLLKESYPSHMIHVARGHNGGLHNLI